ncbi:MAG: ABC transporter substrate-binding protein, partial [Chloroflexales bacterium]|nr:ABC transporter substrate-binding protein [Chloroflexales bacterium]
LADYQARLEALQQALGEQLDATEVSIVRFMPGQVRIYEKASFIGTVIEDAGLPRPSSQSDDVFMTKANKELIAEMDGDVMFLTTYGQPEETDFASFSADPLWQQLEVVQNDRVYEVSDDHWMLGIGILAANRVIDDLERYLLADIARADGRSRSGGAAHATRTISHAMGETEATADPQRVVVLDTGELDNALALGANIVGAPVNDALEYQAYLADQIDGITDIGAIVEPNLEAILALKPDLILGSQQRYEEIYPELEQIAPTVFSASLRVPWQDNFRLHAKALGKTTEAEKLLADYDAHVAEVRAVLGERLDDTTTISIIRFGPGQVWLYLKSSYIGYILQDVGLQRPPSQDEDAFVVEITLEQIADVDADYIFITGYAQNDSELETFLASPLWQTLDAVRNNRAIDVDDDIWIAGLGVQSANAVLDDLIGIFGGDAAEATATDIATDAAFPVTIEHKFGAAEIPAEPKRVVSLGYSEQDPILALGVTPVAIRDWFGDQPYGAWPWAQDRLGDAKPQLLQMPFGELNYELIASLQPDLIVATHSGITAEEYETLAQIAPVLAQPAEYPDFNVPWQEQTRLIGRALGREARADKLVAEVEAQIAAAAKQAPELAGKSVAWLFPAGEAGQYWVVGPNTPPLRFLTSLGLVYPDTIAELVGDQDSVGISSERLDLVDVDVLLFYADSAKELAALNDNAIYQTLDVARQDRTIFFVGNDPIYGALSFSTILSLPYAVEELTPRLVEAVGK